MPKFTVRLQLTGAADNEYPDIHNSMSEQGFQRTITSRRGRTYTLPRAEYNIDVDYTIDQVLSMAKVAGGSTGRDFQVLVTQSEHRKWFGLNELTDDTDDS